MDDGLIGGYLGAALLVVSADQEHGVVGSGAEQDRRHEGDGELGDRHAHLAEGGQHAAPDRQAQPDYQQR